MVEQGNENLGMQITGFVLVVVVCGFLFYMYYLWAWGRDNQPPSREQQWATIKEWQARDKAQQEKVNRTGR